MGTLSAIQSITMIVVLVIQNILTLVLILKVKKITERPVVTSKPTMSEEEIKRIINGTINDIFIKRQALVYDLNNVRYYELQDELKIICTEIDSVFGESFKKEFAFYFTEEYFYKYIVNLVELLLLDDLKKRRVKN